MDTWREELLVDYWSRAMVDKSVDHANDYLSLATSGFCTNNDYFPHRCNFTFESYKFAKPTDILFSTRNNGNFEGLIFYQS